MLGIRFIALLLFLVAVVAFVMKRVMDRRDETPDIEEILAEILPFLDDPAALHRKVARDLRKRRIRGAGTIIDIMPTPTAEVVRVRDRAAVEIGGAAVERDVIYALGFMRPDTLDDVGLHRYVEFTGILMDITAITGTPLITVDPGEILYIGDGPADEVGPEDEEFPETGGPF